MLPSLSVVGINLKFYSAEYSSRFCNGYPNYCGARIYRPCAVSEVGDEKADFGNSAEWRASDAFVAEKRLSHANVLDTGGSDNANCDIKTDRVGYETVVQQVVKEASVARRQFFTVLAARKVHSPLPIAAITVFARDSFGVGVVQQRVQFHGQKSHG